MTPLLRHALVLGLAFVLGVGSIASHSCHAQDPWDYTPYKVRLWVITAEESALPDSLRKAVERQWVERAEAVVGAPWDIIAASPPQALRLLLDSQIATVTSEQFLAKLPTSIKKPTPTAEGPAESEPVKEELSATEVALKEIVREDKLAVVVVRISNQGGYEVNTRWFDGRSRRWGNHIQQIVPNPELISVLAFNSLYDNFLPIARLENSKDKHATFRLRGTGLVTQEDSIVLASANSIFRPFVRLNDRYGDPRAGGINPIAWTYVIVEERDGSKLKCSVESGMPSPLGGRSNPRNERFALLVPKISQSTVLKLRTTDKPPQPMSGYNVYAKNPQTDDVEEIGRTDWRGRIEVPPHEFPLRLVYLRNGSQLLARLPLVPGIDAEQTVELQSDDRRLQAEGFLSGVQSTLMDLLAQRELLATRFRRRLDEGKYNDAEKLLLEFQTLETRDDLNRLLDQQQGRITSPHKSVQTKINKMFDDTRKLVMKFVDPDMGNKLANELAQAKEGRRPASSPASPSPSASPPTTANGPGTGTVPANTQSASTPPAA